MAARMRSIMPLIASLVFAGCEAASTGTAAHVARDKTVSLEDAPSSRGADHATGQWRYGGIEDESSQASVPSVTSHPRIMLIFERKREQRVGALLRWSDDEAPCMPEAKVAIVIDGDKTTHRALREDTSGDCRMRLSDGHLLWLGVAGASELTVEPVGPGGPAAIFDVGGLDREVLDLVPVVR